MCGCGLAIAAWWLIEDRRTIMRKRRVHFLTCETRAATLNGTKLRDVNLRSQRRLPHGARVHNLCANLRWEAHCKSASCLLR